MCNISTSRAQRCLCKPPTQDYARVQAQMPYGKLVIRLRYGLAEHVSRYPTSRYLCIESGPKRMQSNDITASTCIPNILASQSEEASTSPCALQDSGVNSTAHKRFAARSVSKVPSIRDGCCMLGPVLQDKSVATTPH